MGHHQNGSAVVALGDPQRVVGVRLDQLPAILGRLWRLRGQVDGPIGIWLRQQAEPLMATILVGSAPLTPTAANAIIGLLTNRQILAPNEYAKRVVNVLSEDSVATYPSARAAAKAHGVSHVDVARRLRTWRLDAANRLWI